MVFYFYSDATTMAMTTQLGRSTALLSRGIIGRVGGLQPSLSSLTVTENTPRGVVARSAVGTRPMKRFATVSEHGKDEDNKHNNMNNQKKKREKDKTASENEFVGVSRRKGWEGERRGRANKQII